MKILVSVLMIMIFYWMYLCTTYYYERVVPVLSGCFIFEFTLLVKLCFPGPVYIYIIYCKESNTVFVDVSDYVQKL